MSHIGSGQQVEGTARKSKASPSEHIDDTAHPSAKKAKGPVPLSAVSSSVLQPLSSCSSESETDKEGVHPTRPPSDECTTVSESDEVSEVKIDDHARDAKRATVDSESEEY